MKFGRLIATLMFTIFILTAGNCQATMPRSEMFLGGLTVDSPLSELKKIYGEPQEIYSGAEGNRAGTYGNNVLIVYNINMYNISRSNVESIHIMANNGWKTPAGISVGTNISKVFDLYGQPDYIKSNSTKTVCVYYPNDFVEYRGKMVPDFGLFIKYNNDSKKISEMYLAWGFNGMYGFDERYPDAVYDIAERMLKTDNPIEDFIKRQAERDENTDWVTGKIQ